MSEDGDNANEAPRGAPAQPEGGIFSKLPDSRPGTRSPRRRTPGAEAAPQRRKPAPKRAQPKPRPKPATVKTAKAPTAKAGAPRRSPPPQAGPADERAAGLEDIAWAGVAAAAEAATLGVRLANKAIEALRGTSERR